MKLDPTGTGVVVTLVGIGLLSLTIKESFRAAMFSAGFAGLVLGATCPINLDDANVLTAVAVVAIGGPMVFVASRLFRNTH
jgi:hypothetical protein